MALRGFLQSLFRPFFKNKRNSTTSSTSQDGEDNNIKSKKKSIEKESKDGKSIVILKIRTSGRRKGSSTTKHPMEETVKPSKNEISIIRNEDIVIINEPITVPPPKPARSVIGQVPEKLENESSHIEEQVNNSIESAETFNVDIHKSLLLSSARTVNSVRTDSEQKDGSEREMEFLELSKTSQLKAEQFSGSQSAYLHGDKGELLAKQTIIKYTPTQAYCVLSALSPTVADKEVKVYQEDLHHLKLVSIENERENRRLLPIFVQFHTVPEARNIGAHLTDCLAETALGRFNLELKKNVTLDSFALSDTWRDEAGFIVTDRNSFEYVTYDVKELQKTLLPSPDAPITKFNAGDLVALGDFDHSVCGFNREAMLEFVSAHLDVYIVKNGETIDGVIAGRGEQVSVLYAETLDIAHALLQHYIKLHKLTQVRFFTKTDVWEGKPQKSRTVFRRHTRAVPTCIKWNKVYALNMGAHIV